MNVSSFTGYYVYPLAFPARMRSKDIITQLAFPARIARILLQLAFKAGIVRITVDSKCAKHTSPLGRRIIMIKCHPTLW